MYLLDTNACIRVLNGTSKRLVETLRSHPPTSVRLCSVVKAELYHGARKSRRVEDNLQLLQRFFEPFTCLPFEDTAAEHYGLIRSDLESAGTPIGPNDLMIAAIARANDLTLVTHNAREFTRVPGLRTVDWESP